MKRRLAALVMLVATLHASGPAFAQQPKAPPAGAAAAKPVDLITKGQQLFDDQQYEESIQTLSAALLKPNNTRDQKVEIYRLLALNYITLNRKDEAENAVRGLLTINPDYALPPNESPRFRDFFAAAQKKWEAEGRPGWVKDQPPQKAITFKHASPSEVDHDKAIALVAKLDDPDGKVASVKVSYRTGNKGEFTESEATRGDGGSIKFEIPAPAVQPPLVEYFFTGYDEQGNAIANRGDASTPLRIAVSGGGGLVLPLAIGGGVLGAAAIFGVLALAGVFKGSSSGGGGPGAAGKSTVTVNVGDQGFGVHFR